MAPCPGILSMEEDKIILVVVYASRFPQVVTFGIPTHQNQLPTTPNGKSDKSMLESPPRVTYFVSNSHINKAIKFLVWQDAEEPDTVPRPVPLIKPESQNSPGLVRPSVSPLTEEPFLENPTSVHRPWTQNVQGNASVNDRTVASCLVDMLDGQSQANNSEAYATHEQDQLSECSIAEPSTAAGSRVISSPPNQTKDESSSQQSFQKSQASIFAPNEDESEFLKSVSPEKKYPADTNLRPVWQLSSRSTQKKINDWTTAEPDCKPPAAHLSFDAISKAANCTDLHQSAPVYVDLPHCNPSINPTKTKHPAHQLYTSQFPFQVHPYATRFKVDKDQIASATNRRFLAPAYLHRSLEFYLLILLQEGVLGDQPAVCRASFSFLDFCGCLVWPSSLTAIFLPLLFECLSSTPLPESHTRVCLAKWTSSLQVAAPLCLQPLPMSVCLLNWVPPVGYSLESSLLATALNAVQTAT